MPYKAGRITDGSLIVCDKVLLFLQTDKHYTLLVTMLKCSNNLG